MPGLTVGGARRRDPLRRHRGQQPPTPSTPTGRRSSGARRSDPPSPATQQAAATSPPSASPARPSSTLRRGRSTRVVQQRATLRQTPSRSTVTGAGRAGYPAVIAAPDSNGPLSTRGSPGQRGALALPRRPPRTSPSAGSTATAASTTAGGDDHRVQPHREQTAFATRAAAPASGRPAGPRWTRPGRIFVATGNSTPSAGNAGSLGEFVLRFASGASGPTLALRGYGQSSSARPTRTNLDLQTSTSGSVAPCSPVGAGASPLLLPGRQGGDLPARRQQPRRARCSARGSAPAASSGAMSAWTSRTDTCALRPRARHPLGCSNSTVWSPSARHHDDARRARAPD